MDVKSVFRSIIPQALRPKEVVDKPIKSDSTTDRDGNGQTPYQQGEQHHEPMTDEEFKKALEHLKALPSYKEHNLSIQVTMVDGRRIVILKESSGKVVRKITESELWSLIKVKDTEKGQLLSKTA